MNYKNLKVVSPNIAEDFNLKVAPLAIQNPNKPKIRPMISSLSKLNVGTIMPEIETAPIINLFAKPKVLEDEPIWRTYKDFNNSH
jgi:hypothetical protein